MYTQTKIFPVFAPIQKKGRTYDKMTKDFREAYNRPGVYIIFKSVKGEFSPIYVGKSNTNAGKSAARHFYRYNDKKTKDERGEKNANFQYRTSFENEKKTAKFLVKFYLWPEGKTTEKERDEIGEKEADLIRKLSPKYNRDLNPF